MTGCKDIGIRKLDFVAKTRLICHLFDLFSFRMEHMIIQNGEIYKSRFNVDTC